MTASNAVAVDRIGNSYVTGQFGCCPSIAASLVFGSGEANETVLVSTGVFSPFVAKYRVFDSSRASTSTTLQVSSNVITFGEPLTLTAMVASGAGIPTGTVEFFTGSTSLGAAAVSGGVAERDVSLGVGVHTLSAVYAGDGSFLPSTSNTLHVEVVGPPPVDTAPALEVAPSLVEFGAVEIGSFSTAMVTISSTGDTDLTVTHIFLASGAPFSITDMPTPPVVIPPGDFVAVVITFTPTVANDLSDTLLIRSDDPHQPEVSVPLDGSGVVTALTPDEEIQQILDFLDKSVDMGSLEGSGPGASGEGRLNTLRNILLAASDLLRQGNTEEACAQLRQTYLRTDGDPRPPDFVNGTAREELGQMIMDLIESLGCP